MTSIKDIGEYEIPYRIKPLSYLNNPSNIKDQDYLKHYEAH